MARKPRIEFAGAVYHVISRGDRGEAIYQDEEDRRLFLQFLGEVCERTGWLIHAFVAMTNHYHLLGNPGGQFSGRDEMASRNVHPEIQSAPSPSGAFISRAVQGPANRWRGTRPFFAGEQLYPPQPGQSRPGQSQSTSENLPLE